MDGGVNGLSLVFVGVLVATGLFRLGLAPESIQRSQSSSGLVLNICLHMKINHMALDFNTVV